MKRLYCKVAVIVVLIVLSALCFTGCNKSLFDTTYKFDRAIISLPNWKIIEGKVQEWCDYDGDQLQVKIGGVTYLVHSTDCVLIAE